MTIDPGGEFIPQIVQGIGGATVSTGYAAAIPIVWSNDGRRIYYLKKLDGIVQVWRGSLDGRASERLTSEARDVKDFVVSSDGKRVVYSTSAPDLIKERLRREESLRGYRYDERFIPLFTSGPDAFPTDTISIRSVDLETGAADRASADDVASLLAKGTVSNSPEATPAQGRVASARSEAKPGRTEPAEIIVSGPGRQATLCADTRCSGAMLMWWVGSGRRLRYIRREGWGRDETAIYEWQPGRTPPKRLYVTTDLLVGCQPIEDNLLCAREQSRAPRHLVLLDPAGGVVRVVYDPNPDFSRLALGGVERLRWRNDFGIETFGDLVYPTGYERGRAYPLIVVQYTSRGFLRGGVGDEFPIQAFANRGYAVLSIQRPDGRNLVPLSMTTAEYERELISGFKDRRSVLSSIEFAVRLLVNRGIVDPDRVGITGLSDGSSTVQFAAVNSKTFKAASVSGCCWEPFQDAFIGPGAAKAFHEIGWPRLVDYDEEFWSHISLIHNARRMSMPLLMQQSDDEFRAAIASYTAMKQAGQPVSLFVFPGEHHVKWQPSHRLAAYERNLRWFDYWLKGVGSAEEWGLDN
ncbi:hypothetical protein Sbs19_40270 [Sphingobium sp. BS19]|nr:hypothetical protein Sbs19_40270 [Sphingobium sp. BS19]